MLTIEPRGNILKITKNKEVYNAPALNIQAYGERNDYPQLIQEIVANSITGRGCLDTFQKFVKGRGFVREEFGRAIANSKKETFNEVLHKVADDLCTYGGFALHINYNALAEIVSIAAMPFECLRFERADKDGRFNRLA